GGRFLLGADKSYNGLTWDNKDRIQRAWSVGGTDSLAMSLDERTVAVGLHDGGVRLIDFHTYQTRAYYRWQANGIGQVAFSSDGRTLAASTIEGDVYELDARAVMI